MEIIRCNTEEEAASKVTVETITLVAWPDQTTLAFCHTEHTAVMIQSHCTVAQRVQYTPVGLAQHKIRIAWPIDKVEEIIRSRVIK